MNEPGSIEWLVEQFHFKSVDELKRAARVTCPLNGVNVGLASRGCFTCGGCTTEVTPVPDAIEKGMRDE